MNQETRLRDFAQRQRQRTARPVRRGGIDPACRLPTLARLLEIDRAAEQAVAQAGRPVGERNAGDSTAETLDGYGAADGHGAGRPPGPRTP